MTMTMTKTMTMDMTMTMTMTKRYKLGIQYNKYKDRQINQIVIIEQNDKMQVAQSLKCNLRKIEQEKLVKVKQINFAWEPHGRNGV